MLFLLFIVQFTVACACLAIGPNQQKSLFRSGWSEAGEGLRTKMQDKFDCCGATADDQLERVNDTGLSHPACTNTSVSVHI